MLKALDESIRKLESQLTQVKMERWRVERTADIDMKACRNELVKIKRHGYDDIEQQRLHFAEISCASSKHSDRLRQGPKQKHRPNKKENTPFQALGARPSQRLSVKPVAKQQEESLFVSDDDEVPNEPAKLPTIPHSLHDLPYTEMVMINGKIRATITAPPHPGMSLFLFRKRTSSSYKFWRVGCTPSDGRVGCPIHNDIIIDHTADNLKVLYSLFQHMRSRWRELRQKWWETNGHAGCDIVSNTDKFFLEPFNSSEIKSLVQQSSLRKLVVVLPVYGKRGGIDMQARGTSEQRRVLFLRGTKVLVEGKGVTYTEEYFETGSDTSVKKEPGDIILPESEATLERLWHGIWKVVPGDLVDTWSLKTRRYSSGYRDGNQHERDQQKSTLTPGKRAHRNDTEWKDDKTPKRALASEQAVGQRESHNLKRR